MTTHESINIVTGPLDELRRLTDTLTLMFEQPDNRAWIGRASRSLRLFLDERQLYLPFDSDNLNAIVESSVYRSLGPRSWKRLSKSVGAQELQEFRNEHPET
jgi:hypothetical protein